MKHKIHAALFLVGSLALVGAIAATKGSPLLDIAKGTQSKIPLSVSEPLVAVSTKDKSLKWNSCAGDNAKLEVALRGCEAAVVRTDPKTGAMVLFVRSPASAVFAAHWHTHFESIMGIEGTMRVFYEDGRHYDISPGRYLFNPAGLAHSAQCLPGKPCVFVVHTDKTFDLNLPPT